MKVLRKPTEAEQSYVIEFEKDEIIVTDDGPVIEEVAIPNSDQWASKSKVDIGKKVVDALMMYQDVIELTIRVSKNWTVRRLMRPARLVVRIEDENEAKKG